MICAFTSVCLEDERWVGQYVSEAERLDLPFVVLLDRCPSLFSEFFRSKRCVDILIRPEDSPEFDETCKQPLIERVRGLGFEWAMGWDVDETYEPRARERLDEIDDSGYDYVQCTWVNLWGDDRHLRVDGPFAFCPRYKFYRLSPRDSSDMYGWRFGHKITNGAKHTTRIELKTWRSPLVCIHHGMKTRELREQHKERWDRIYSTALRGDPNPYKFWAYALDEENHPPVIVDNPYV